MAMTMTMTRPGQLKSRVRSDYPYRKEYRTRWNDNDTYDHVNNSIYAFLYDSIINTYLIEHCELNPPSPAQYALVVYSQVHYLGSFAFPAVADVGLRVKSLGQSSVIYELALFEQGIDQVKSVGEYVHVFVDRATGRPAARGMNATVRGGLQRIAVGPQAKL